MSENNMHEDVQEYQLEFGKFKGMTIKDIADAGNIFYLIWLSGEVNKWTIKSRDEFKKVAEIHPTAVENAKSYLKGLCTRCRKRSCDNNRKCTPFAFNQSFRGPNYHYHPYGKR